jgi:two-component system catabolic regulation response regulator CreB
MVQRILVVEDEPAIAESVAYALRRDGFEALVAGRVAEAEDGAASAALVVLDLMLPDGSGFELLHRWRRAGIGTPIIVLSSRDDESDRVAALEAGADDYVTKPFSPREVIARVRAVLRRTAPPGPGDRANGGVAVDEETRRAYVDKQEVELTRVEFDLLSALLTQPGRVFTRAQLIAAVWGDGYALSDRTIDSHIKSLRRKLSDVGSTPSSIDTVRGVGYRLLLGEVTDEKAL